MPSLTHPAPALQLSPNQFFPALETPSSISTSEHTFISALHKHSKPGLCQCWLQKAGNHHIWEFWRYHLPNLISDLIWAGHFFRKKVLLYKDYYKVINSNLLLKFPYHLHSTASKIINDISRLKILKCNSLLCNLPPTVFEHPGY